MLAQWAQHVGPLCPPNITIGILGASLNSNALFHTIEAVDINSREGLSSQVIQNLR
jgi:hypothetical protein